MRALPLRHLVQAVLESPRPEAFRMGCLVRGDISDDPPHRREEWCGLPGCVLGHYGARTDLQSLLKIGTAAGLPALVFHDGSVVDFDEPRICEHFGISAEEATELFCANGCGGAGSVEQAAAYLNSFIERMVA